MELLVGCGSNRAKKLWLEAPQWSSLVTLDMVDTHKPDVVWDLEKFPLPFEDNKFDEIHAYDVLEHMGRQGDWSFFFAQWQDFWRLLKPGGLFFGICPAPHSPWAWGDPGHTRVIAPESLVFLSQKNYGDQVGRSPMTDYRFCYKADFELVHSSVSDTKQHAYALRAVKSGANGVVGSA
jgi:SAM-dependent methyltransferase